MGVVYFGKALGTVRVHKKMMIPGVKFKIVKNLISVLTPYTYVKNLISVSTLTFWGWLGFFKGRRLEVGARRAPKLVVPKLVVNIFLNYIKVLLNIS